MKRLAGSARYLLSSFPYSCSLDSLRAPTSTGTILNSSLWLKRQKNTLMLDLKCFLQHRHAWATRFFYKQSTKSDFSSIVSEPRDSATKVSKGFTDQDKTCYDKVNFTDVELKSDVVYTVGITESHSQQQRMTKTEFPSFLKNCPGGDGDVMVSSLVSTLW